MAGITRVVRGAAPLRIPVARARVTVTGLVTEVSMTVTPAAGVTWSAVPTTARSSQTTITRRMTAASDPTQASLRAGAPGAPGQPAAGHTNGSRGGVERPGPGTVRVRDVAPARNSRYGNIMSKESH